MLLDAAEGIRQRSRDSLNSATQQELAQYLTPAPVAEFMASLFKKMAGDITLLDPGAGTGILTAAFVRECLRRDPAPGRISADLYEIDSDLHSPISEVLKLCEQAVSPQRADFSGNVRSQDFIEAGVETAIGQSGLFTVSPASYTHCIINPPYKKIRSGSRHRILLRRLGVETSNLYSGFLAVAIRLLGKRGELVAIVPRSFCNGPYFRPFRVVLLREMALVRLHVFSSRNQAFKGDNVLQENLILHAIKGIPQSDVCLSTSFDSSFTDLTERTVVFEEVVHPDDSELYIRIAANGFDEMVRTQLRGFKQTLQDLGLAVCTGPVVDFRVRSDLRQEPGEDTFPLIYPGNLATGYVEWPTEIDKKPKAIAFSDRSAKWLMNNDWYVLVRRFSAKEEKRRIVAAVHNPNHVPGKKVGFENHLNVIHRSKQGLDPQLARGLTIYLNSTLVDLHFRQFSGHTQVNATDLRNIPYPDENILRNLGSEAEKTLPEIQAPDLLLKRVIKKMIGGENDSPSEILDKTGQALDILHSLGMPRSQQNERSALTLLALIRLKPEDDWKLASNPLIGITPIMDFMRHSYGKDYAPNTRETIRRQSMHQFVAAGIAVVNPDEPDRPINSPKWCYQIEPSILRLLKTYGTNNWEAELGQYLSERETLASRYARQREMHMVPVTLSDGSSAKLSPGAHSQLIKAIIEDFAQRHAPGAQVLYIGDTGAKTQVFDQDAFARLGLTFDTHGKFPDVVLFQQDKGWLLLIESVTSHGPVDPKRHSELEALFEDCDAGLVFITAFPDRTTMARYLSEISWETDVWVAESPTHLIHFDGERFLGPY
jgi:adenine-specific DNA-methyltransferase